MKDDILAGQKEGCREEVILATLLLVILLIEPPFEFFEILIEHILPAQLLPAPEVVDSHMGEDPVALEHPVDLLFIAPHHVPVIIICFSPVPSR